MMASKLIQRVEYIDVFRGFGILFMIMGHIGFGGYFDYFIHSFHMPLFVFVSGYFYDVNHWGGGKRIYLY